MGDKSNHAISATAKSGQHLAVPLNSTSVLENHPYGVVCDEYEQPLEWASISARGSSLEILADIPSDGVEGDVKATAYLWNMPPSEAIPLELHIQRPCFSLKKITFTVDGDSSTLGVDLGNCGKVGLKGSIKIRNKDGSLVVERPDVSIGVKGSESLKFPDVKWKPGEDLTVEYSLSDEITLKQTTKVPPAKDPAGRGVSDPPPPSPETALDYVRAAAASASAAQRVAVFAAVGVLTVGAGILGYNVALERELAADTTVTAEAVTGDTEAPGTTTPPDTSDPEVIVPPVELPPVPTAAPLIVSTTGDSVVLQYPALVDLTVEVERHRTGIC